MEIRLPDSSYPSVPKSFINQPFVYLSKCNKIFLKGKNELCESDFSLLVIPKPGVQNMHNGQYSKIEQKKEEIKEIILGLGDLFLNQTGICEIYLNTQVNNAD